MQRRNERSSRIVVIGTASSRQLPVLYKSRLNRTVFSMTDKLSGAMKHKYNE